MSAPVTSAPVTPGWLTLDEAAAYTGRHRETVRRAAVEYQRSNSKAGLRAAQQKAHACWRFKAADLDRWVMGEAPARMRAA
jgi:hypothetical protein